MSTTVQQPPVTNPRMARRVARARLHGGQLAVVERQRLQVDIGAKRHALGVDGEDAAAAGGVGRADIDQLVEPAYKDLLVVQNPATSTPGLAFLL